MDCRPCMFRRPWVVFIGAGTRLLAYQLKPRPSRLWVDEADLGFLQWSVHTGAVLMAAELELAAWTPDGRKLWSTFVEPPWDFDVDGSVVRATVMGSSAEFSITGGPPPGSGGDRAPTSKPNVHSWLYYQRRGHAASDRLGSTRPGWSCAGRSDPAAHTPGAPRRCSVSVGPGHVPRADQGKRLESPRLSSRMRVGEAHPRRTSSSVRTR